MLTRSTSCSTAERRIRIFIPIDEKGAQAFAGSVSPARRCPPSVDGSFGSDASIFSAEEDAYPLFQEKAHASEIDDAVALIEQFIAEQTEDALAGCALARRVELIRLMPV